MHSAFHVLLGFPMSLFSSNVSVGKDILFYSFGVAWMARLEMCMAFSVGVFKLNYFVTRLFKLGYQIVLKSVKKNGCVNYTQPFQNQIIVF